MTDQDKVALVTGSALNIGRAIALHLARDGFRVLVTARQAEHDAEETARLVRESGGRGAVHTGRYHRSGPGQGSDRGRGGTIRPAGRAGQQRVGPPADEILPT